MNERIIISSVASDAHTWNLVYLQLLLEEHGFEIFNLGACIPNATLIEECHKIRPMLLIISTINGHGYYEGRELVRAVKKHNFLKNIPMIIGGKLDTNGNISQTMIAKLLADGYDAVFTQEQAITHFLDYMGVAFKQRLVRQAS